MKNLDRDNIFPEGCNSVELDFSYPPHAEYFLQKFGGEELLKSEFPLVYEAFLNTQKEHAENKMKAENADSGTTGYGMVDNKFYINGLVYDPKTDVFTGLNSYLKEQQVSMIVSGALTDKTHNIILDSCYEIYDQPFKDSANTELKYPSINLVRQEDSVITSNADYTLVKRPSAANGKCTLSHNALKEYAAIKILGGSSLVESFTIDDPKTSKPGNILLLYNRTAGEGEDTKYYYPDVSKDDKNMVEVNIPIKGSIKFVSNVTNAQYSTTSETTNILVEFSDNGSISFNYTPEQIKEFFTWDATTHTLSFSFPRDWNTKLNTSDLGTSTVLTLRCSFYLDVTYGEDTNIVGCCINSVSALGPGEQYYTSAKPSVRVPMITIRWGCFGKDTKITMADGTQKQISDIKAGDQVLSDKKESLTVKELIYGHEDSVIYMKTDAGEELSVSESHPVVTQRGIVVASNLNAGDLLVRADGSQASLADLYKKDYHDKVYNLKIDSVPQIIIANGFLAGDFEAQNDPTLTPKKKIAPETIQEAALREEFNKLYEKLKSNR
ncbi:hypothetical protein JCM14036_22150 [Desulfotomaculum defluvii]